MIKKVLLGVTGSIAAYKSADLVRLMRRKEWDVSVIMTRSATEFIGETTLRTLSRNPVAIEMFAKSDEWIPSHISLADQVKLFVVAPCTANVIAKLAHGIADDLLTCTALSCTAPLVIAPAMNEKMLCHPATQANIKTLKQRGVSFIEPGKGELACGCSGRGRMAEPEDIMKTLAKFIK